jgi:hypothetical protein
MNKLLHTWHFSSFKRQKKSRQPVSILFVPDTYLASLEGFELIEQDHNHHLSNISQSDSRVTSVIEVTGGEFAYFSDRLVSFCGKCLDLFLLWVPIGSGVFNFRNFATNRPAGILMPLIFICVKRKYESSFIRNIPFSALSA